MTSTRSPMMLVVCASLLLCLTPAARAQERGNIGVTIGAPTSVGIVAHITSRIAAVVGADASWTSFSSDHDVVYPPDLIDSARALGLAVVVIGTTHEEQSTTVVNLSFGARLQLSSTGNTRVYVTPAFSKPFHTDSQSSILDGVDGGDTSSYAVSGQVGIQHALADRFSVFGEAGLEFSRSKTSFDSGTLLVSRSTSTYRHVGTTGHVGVVYYFKR